MVGRIEPDELSVPGDPGVPRGAIEPVDQRTIRELPGQRMLAPAGPEQKQVHESAYMRPGWRALV